MGLFDVGTGSCDKIFSGHTAGLSMAKFSPDGQQILTASHDNTSGMFDIASGRCSRAFLGHTGHIYMASFSMDGKKVVTAAADSTSRVFDAVSGACVAVFAHSDKADERIYFSSFSFDGA